METDEQISKKELSEPSEISPDNPSSVTSTPCDNKRDRDTAFTPENKESRQCPKLDLSALKNCNFEPDEVPVIGEPVIKISPTMGDLKDKPGQTDRQTDGQTRPDIEFLCD